MKNNSIINVIKEKGYEACNEEEYCRSSDDYIRKISIVVIIIMLYILISETGIINMLVPGRLAGCRSIQSCGERIILTSL